MAVQRLSLVAPSGGRVSIELPAEPLVSSIVAGVRFAGGSFGTGLQIGPRGHHDFACRYVAPARPRERMLVHGREVVVAEAEDGQSSVATLLGAYHELMTVYAGPAPRGDRVFGLFSSLVIEDRVDGMMVRPRSATLLDTMSEHMIVVVDGVGSLSIPGPRQAPALLPRHAGAPTKYGEVWKAAHSFILGCAAGLAEVYLSGDQSLAWLDEINVEWR